MLTKLQTGPERKRPVYGFGLFLLLLLEKIFHEKMNPPPQCIQRMASTPKIIMGWLAGLYRMTHVGIWRLGKTVPNGIVQGVSRPWGDRVRPTAQLCLEWVLEDDQRERGQNGLYLIEGTVKR